MNERYISVILTNGERLTWQPPHVPISQQNDSTMVFVWERTDGLIQNIAINLEQIAVLEMGVVRADQDPESIAWIDKAKEKDAE